MDRPDERHHLLDIVRFPRGRGFLIKCGRTPAHGLTSMNCELALGNVARLFGGHRRSKRSKLMIPAEKALPIGKAPSTAFSLKMSVRFEVLEDVIVLMLGYDIRPAAAPLSLRILPWPPQGRRVNRLANG